MFTSLYFEWGTSSQVTSYSASCVDVHKLLNVVVKHHLLYINSVIVNPSFMVSLKGNV